MGLTKLLTCNHRRYRRHFIKLFLLLLLIAAVYYGYIYSVEESYFHENYVNFVQQYSRNNQSAGCALPKLDPWDERAKPYYDKVTPITCVKIQPYLTEVTNNGLLQWNLTEYKAIDTNNFECTYQELTRTEKNDFTITKLPLNVFLGSVQLKEAFVIVSCRRGKTLYYYNIHSWIPPNIYEDLKTSGAMRPNVLIFMLDAMSRSNFIRQLPMTYKVLTEEMSMIEMKGLIKVGLNTFPNLGAMLTGINVDSHKLPSKADGYDVWPCIWKNFSQAGYVTSFAEDMPDASAFNYKERGFNQQPTDYYMRPFWLAMLENYELIRGRSSRRCFGNIGEHRVILDFVKNSLMVYKNYSFFTLTSLGALSHDYLNLVQVLDDEISQLFHWFYENHSENTILIVMGDHGINYGEFRLQTQLGRVESAMPFFSIYLPQHLRKSYPNLEMNLRINQDRMSSWFDVYDTLMDIVSLRFDKPRKSWSKNGISLFHPHPTIRTCNEAGIPQEHCPCEEEIELPLDSAIDLTTIAKDIVIYLNNLLQNSSQCSPLTFSYIESAVKIIPNSNTAIAKGFQNIFRLTIVVDPSHALLEATMKSDAWSEHYEPVGMIIRLDKFGNTTNCVQDRLLIHYCCCHC